MDGGGGENISLRPLFLIIWSHLGQIAPMLPSNVDAPAWQGNMHWIFTITMHDAARQKPVIRRS